MYVTTAGDRRRSVSVKHIKAMTELNIISIKWEKIPVTRTRAEFENGAQDYALKPVVMCELPAGFNVFQMDSQPDVFLVKDQKIVMLSMTGYHMGNGEILLSTGKTFDKEFEVKVYSL